MGIPRILPMRKPDPRFMSVPTFSLAQDIDGSGEGEISYDLSKAPPPHPGCFSHKECYRGGESMIAGPRVLT